MAGQTDWIDSMLMILNKFDGWDLKHEPVKDKFTAIGFTPKNYPCVIWIHYENCDPYVPANVYRNMSGLNENVAKLIWFVNKKGNWMFWLDDIKADLKAKQITLKYKDARIENIND